jgi:hypothetical protein
MAWLLEAVGFVDSRETASLAPSRAGTESNNLLLNTHMAAVMEPSRRRDVELRLRVAASSATLGVDLRRSPRSTRRSWGWRCCRRRGWRTQGRAPPAASLGPQRARWPEQQTLQVERRQAHRSSSGRPSGRTATGARERSNRSTSTAAGPRLS